MTAPLSKGAKIALAIVTALALIVAIVFVTNEPAEANSDGNDGKVCIGQHLVADDGKNDEPTETYTAPAGYLISELCSKAGSANQVGGGPVYTKIDPPKAVVTITHPSGKDISHFSVVLVPIGSEGPKVVESPSFPFATEADCDTDGSLTVAPPAPELNSTTTVNGTPVTAAVTFGPGEYVIVHTANEGYVYDNNQPSVTHTVVVAAATGDCEVPETPTETPTPTVPVTPTPTTPTETPVTPETPTEGPCEGIAGSEEVADCLGDDGNPNTPDKDKDEPVKNSPNSPNVPQNVQVIECVDGVFVTTVNGEVISESGSCVERDENETPVTFNETGL